MRRFADLLDRLSTQPQRNAKIRLLIEYFEGAPDPDRGYALAALTSDLDFARAKPAMLRGLVMERVDPVLFGLSYDYVGDLAETASLIWPEPPEAQQPASPFLSDVVHGLETASKSDIPALIARWFDALDPTGRWALGKLITGALRVGVSARLAKTALAQMGGIEVNALEEIWPGLKAPYADLFAWLEGAGPMPEIAAQAPFRPVMLATPFEDPDWGLDPRAYRAEWKWDGIRIQAVSEKGNRRLYSRTGEDISGTFPDVIEAMDFEGAVDGELLVARDGVVAPFSDLQKRLNRKTVSVKLIASHPVIIRAYDLLMRDGRDLRPEPFDVRRAALEEAAADWALPFLDLSQMVSFETWEELAEKRAGDLAPGVEGLMLKRGDSPYTPGRAKGPWFKWKRDPFLIDAVLLYAQRGHGKRSSFYSDYTFGVWHESEDGPALIPVGKAYFGFTDAELKDIDKFIRQNTTNRFGPVREVVHGPDEGLVLEVAFEGLQRSPRHKSGVAMRFPRVNRLRWDKPPREADTLQALSALLPPEA
ncbi:MAG: cisplatin damage response ATP-dependent DNA ligase [Alphaproteobacteria bacterium]